MVYLVVVCRMVNKWTQEDRAGSQGGLRPARPT